MTRLHTCIRPTDQLLYQSVEIALVQLGYKSTRCYLDTLHMQGTIGMGVIDFQTGGHAGKVFLDLGKNEKNDSHLHVNYVRFDYLGGNYLNDPKVVLFHDTERYFPNLIDLLNISLVHRNTVIYELLTAVLNRPDRLNVMQELGRYPVVSYQGSTCKLTYNLCGEEVPCIYKLELFFDCLRAGFTSARISRTGDATRCFEMQDFTTGIWNEVP
jgi:hypothetical protein